MVEARQVMERTIAIETKHFDPDHPTRATSYNNLGHIALAEGKQDEACKLFRRAHANWNKHFTADHPHIRMIERMMTRECRGDEG